LIAYFKGLQNPPYCCYYHCGYLYYHISDHLGSTRVLVDSTGRMFSAYDYYAGGEKTPLNWVYQGTNYQYIGREFDEETGINLNYMIGRYYDAKSQSFMSIEPMLNRPAGLLRNFDHSFYYGSPYTYALDNPVCKLDPNGKETRIYSVTVGIFGIGPKHLFIVVQNENLGVKTSFGFYPASRAAAVWNVLGPDFDSGNEIVLRTDDPGELGEVKKLEAGKKSGATLEAVITPPKGTTSEELDKAVINGSDNYPLGGVEYNFNGPNSNTIVDNVIENTRASMPNTGARAQNYGDGKGQSEDKSKTEKIPEPESNQ